MARMPPTMEEHPDIAAMRATYERANETRIAQWLEGATLLASLYLAISPWVAGFAGESQITVSNLISGLTALVVTLGLAAAYGRTHGVAWVVPVIGAWAFVSPWIIEGTDAPGEAVGNNIVIGLVLAALGVGVTAIGWMRGTRRTAPAPGG